MDIRNMTPSEVALTRKIELLESKLKVYEAPFEPTYMTEDAPSIINVHSLTTPMVLGIKARVKRDDQGYHVYAKDVRDGYSINYYISDRNLNTNRYRVTEFMDKMLKDITMQLAHNVMEGKA